MGALSKLDEFLLNPQVPIWSVAVPGTSRNNDSENGKLTGDLSVGHPCPEAVLFSTYHGRGSDNLNDLELGESHHCTFECFPKTGPPKKAGQKNYFA